MIESQNGLNQYKAIPDETFHKAERYVDSILKVSPQTVLNARPLRKPPIWRIYCGLQPEQQKRVRDELIEVAVSLVKKFRGRMNRVSSFEFFEEAKPEVDRLKRCLESTIVNPNVNINKATKDYVWLIGEMIAYPTVNSLEDLIMRKEVESRESSNPSEIGGWRKVEY